MFLGGVNKKQSSLFRTLTKKPHALGTDRKDIHFIWLHAFNNDGRKRTARA